MEPKILIISNNALSTTSNNGKTLESFLHYFDKNRIAQLYLKNEIPDSIHCTNFFRITEYDLIKNFFNRKCCGEKIDNSKKNNNIIAQKSLKKNNILIFFRELLWLIGPWKSQKLKKWLNDIKPTHILFCAGDSLFAYRIAFFISKMFKSKFIVFYTDDYYFRKKNKNFLIRVYQHLIKKKIKKSINECDLLLTISDYMRMTYKKIFNKDSVVVANMPSLPTQIVSKHISNSKAYQLVYAGSLYYSRDKMLFEIGEILDLINQKYDTNHILNIYTGSTISTQVNIPKSIRINPSVNKEELNIIFQNSDIFVFVESYEESYTEKTRFSFSTKIPEYLSYRKCVLCYGPDTVGSIIYLKKVAYCITDKSTLYNDLIKLLNDENLCKQIGKKCYTEFLDYKMKVNPKKIYNILCNL